MITLTSTPPFKKIMFYAEVIKYLAGFGELLAGKMLYFNGETMEFNSVDLTKRTDCIVCGSDIT